MKGWILLATVSGGVLLGTAVDSLGKPKTRPDYMHESFGSPSTTSP